MKLQRHIRLDFTPLVDIALILVLAYMVILYHQKAKMMEFGLPDIGGISCGGEEICFHNRNNEVELYLFENYILYVKGSNKNIAIYKSGYSIKEFREMLKIDNYCTDAEKRIVLIKPTSKSIYGNLVTTISRFNQLGFKRFALKPYLIQNEEKMVSQAELLFSKPLIVSQ